MIVDYGFTHFSAISTPRVVLFIHLDQFEAQLFTVRYCSDYYEVLETNDLPSVSLFAVDLLLFELLEQYVAANRPDCSSFVRENRGSLYPSILAARSAFSDSGTAGSRFPRRNLRLSGELPNERSVDSLFASRGCVETANEGARTDRHGRACRSQRRHLRLPLPLASRSSERFLRRCSAEESRSGHLSLRRCEHILRFSLVLPLRNVTEASASIAKGNAVIARYASCDCAKDMPGFLASVKPLVIHSEWVVAPTLRVYEKHAQCTVGDSSSRVDAKNLEEAMGFMEEVADPAGEAMHPTGEELKSRRGCSASNLRIINPLSDFFSLVQSNVKEVIDSRNPVSLDWRVYQLNVEAIEWMKKEGTTDAIPTKLKEFKAKYQKEIKRFYKEYANATKPTQQKEDVEARIIQDSRNHTKQALEQSRLFISSHLAKRVSMIYFETEDDKRYLELLRQQMSAFSRFLP